MSKQYMIPNCFSSYGNVMYILWILYVYFVFQMSILAHKTYHVHFLHITKCVSLECTPVLGNKGMLDFVSMS